MGASARPWPHVAAAVIVVAGVATELVRPVAPPVEDLVNARTFFDVTFLRRADAYRAAVTAAQVAALLVRVVVVCTAALSPPGRRAVAALAGRIGRPSLAAAAVAVSIVVMVDLCVLPLAFWAGYVVDGQYGLRTQGLGGWVRDWVVVHMPAWIAVAVVTAVGYWLAQRLPRTWPLAAAAAMALASLAVAFAAPAVLEPLEFTMTALPPGPVRDEVERVLERADLPATILVADASRRSTRQNAYVSGLAGTNRIVLYDTLLQERPPDEIGVILAHEIGHRRHHDQLRSVAFGTAGAVVAAYVLVAVARRRTRQGKQESPTDPAAAGIIVAVATLLVIASLPLQQAVSRRAESAADHASLELTGAPDTMARMQVELARANLSDPQPWWLAHLLFASHPSPVERISRARAWDAGAGLAR